MHPAEIETCLERMTLLVDTREQENDALRRRLAIAGLPWERKKLYAGDYSVKCPLPDETVLDLSDQIAIERKMSIDELAMCFGSERKRFTAEFDRAYEAGIRIYMLIEGATWEKIFKHQYRSRLHENALVASILAFQARYDSPVLFCERTTTGKLIREILLRELKERLREYGE